MTIGLAHKLTTFAPGQSDVDWEVVAGALASCDGIGADLIRAIAAGDRQAHRRVATSLRRECSMPADLADFVLAVFISPALCPSCCGRGAVMRGVTASPCRPCGGGGRLSATPAQLAHVWGISEQEWESRHAQQFADAYRLLSEWLHDAAKSMSGALR